MAERTRLWVYFAFSAVYTLIYSVAAHWIWGADGWLVSGHAGLRRLDGRPLPGRAGRARRARCCSGRAIGKFDADGKPNAIPGHNMAFMTLGVLILWFGWFGFNPGSTLGVDFGGVGFFAYVALNTNIAAAGGVLGAVVTSWLVIKKPDLSMMLNGAIGALVAITAACAFVAPWAALLIGVVAGVIVVFGVLLVERLRSTTRSARSPRTGWPASGARCRSASSPCRSSPRRSASAAAASSTAAASTSSACRRSGSLAVGVFTFARVVRRAVAFKVTLGIREEPEVETAGLDVSEHGMWGYPELFIPVPGGYGTESHWHLLAHGHAHRAPAPPPSPRRSCRAALRLRGGLLQRRDAGRPPPIHVDDCVHVRRSAALSGARWR